MSAIHKFNLMVKNSINSEVDSFKRVPMLSFFPFPHIFSEIIVVNRSGSIPLISFPTNVCMCICIHVHISHNVV